MSGIPVFSAGTSLQSSGVSVSAQIPADSAGMLPLFVRVTATAAGYFRLSQDGASAAVGDLLIQPSDGLILKTCGLSRFSFVSQSGASTVTVTPIDVGGIKYPTNIFTPAALFTTGVNGAWYDPSDFSTMFQDAAGTTPVTAVGQPVGRILDKSGRGNHAFNPSGNSANFPVLQQDGAGRYYLAFNGVNQWLQTNSIDFTYGDKMFVSAGVRKLSDAALGTVVGLTTGIASNNGAFRLAAPGSAAPNLAWSAKGTTQVDLTSTTYTAPITSIISGTADIAGSSAVQRINGAQTASSASSLGTGNFSNAALYLGATGGASNWLNGRLYGLVVAGKAASASEIVSTEAWLNQKTGAY